TLILDWEVCVSGFGDRHISRLAEYRGYSVEFCEWLRDSKLVGIHEGQLALPVHDTHGNIGGAHVRAKDGNDWFYFPKGLKVHPLIIGELRSNDAVYIFESQWDGFAFADASGLRDGIIISRGASNGALVANAIPPNATCYLFTQNDNAGAKWEQGILANTKC